MLYRLNDLKVLGPWTRNYFKEDFMWIKSKYGFFNVTRVDKFCESGQQTFAFMGSKTAPVLLSDNKVLDTIVEAIKRGYPFLEVE